MKIWRQNNRLDKAESAPINTCWSSVMRMTTFSPSPSSFPLFLFVFFSIGYHDNRKMLRYLKVANNSLIKFPKKKFWILNFRAKFKFKFKKKNESKQFVGQERKTSVNNSTRKENSLWTMFSSLRSRHWNSKQTREIWATECRDAHRSATRHQMGKSRHIRLGFYLPVPPPCTYYTRLLPNSRKLRRACARSSHFISRSIFFVFFF